MSDEYESRTVQVPIPKNTGIDGFLFMLRTILQLPRVQTINIDIRAGITYQYFARTAEDTPGQPINFSDIEPYGLLRNLVVEEYTPGSLSAPVALLGLMDRVAVMHMVPLVFLVGADSHLWRWYQQATGTTLSSRSTLMGYPVRHDRHIPDEAVFLVLGYSRDVLPMEAHGALKVLVPNQDLCKFEVNV